MVIIHFSLFILPKANIQKKKTIDQTLFYFLENSFEQIEKYTMV